jgi:hypothetical protein
MKKVKKIDSWEGFKLGRTTGKRGNPKKRILICCEGKKTEPNYFKAFRVTSAEVIVDGVGSNTSSLVEYAVQKKEEAAKEKEPYDEIWCVFDRDSFPAGNFNSAFDLAKKNTIEIAYSNEAFELWYLLHFHYYNTGISRKLYKKKLSECLNKTYEKNSKTMYEDILPRQDRAIKNAKKLLASFKKGNPENNNPSTTVFKLVEVLNNNSN